MPKVDFQRSDYEHALKDWTLVADVCEGERAVKAKGVAYLPDPNEVSGNPVEDRKVYERYKARAGFFNATGNTLAYLIGAAFRKWPELTVPGGLAYIEQDIDGAGVSIYQQSQDVLAEVLEKGRHGLLVDYPPTDAPASLADKASGRIRASTVSIDAERIINWRTELVGGKHVLTLVVFRDDQEEVSDDGFETTEVEQMRALRLLDGVYVQEVYRKDSSGWTLVGSYVPRTASGQPWTEIPFTFVGARNNDSQVDKGPLLDLAQLNIYHYQVAADWRNALHYAGQPQPWMAGLTQQWVDMLESKGITLGSRSPILLPEGGGFGFATVAADSALGEEVRRTEERMVAIGARLLTPGTAVKTATEAQSENEAQHSALSLAVSNVSEAYTRCLQWMEVFEGVPGDVLYTINQEFVEHTLDAQMLAALIAAFQTGRLPASDLNAVLRKYGLIDPAKTDEEIEEELATSAVGLALDDMDDDGDS